MDPRIHQHVNAFGPTGFENTEYLSNPFPVVWMINGRAAPDTLADAGVGWLPHQPYNAFPRMHPGESILMRVVGAGRDMHPFHHHGNHARVIAHDGRLLQSEPGKGVDLSYRTFTITSMPGSTTDAIFRWTGEGLNWDIYGTSADGQPEHVCTDNFNNTTGTAVSDGYADTLAQGCDPAAATPCFPWEYCEDHGKALPVILPEKADLFFGGFFSGSPFLGTLGALPPGEGGLNPFGGWAFMWHSHTEKELTTDDIFPGGMLSMLIIEAPGVPIP
jgi:hypothetical protein